MSASRCWTRTARIAKRLSVEITVSSKGQVVCEWTPCAPQKRLSGKLLRRYQDARNAVIAEMARETGMNVLVME